MKRSEKNGEKENVHRPGARRTLRRGEEASRGHRRG